MSNEKKGKSTKMPDMMPKATKPTSKEKCVKFGCTNHSKSYKASMKALKHVKNTPSKTPEHGILQSKITKSSGKSKKKKSCKKAPNFF